MRNGDTTIFAKISKSACSGIHTGDVLSRDGDVYGDGINIASRLQSFGEEGSIIFSGDVHDKIKNHPELKSVYLGKHQLKNVLSVIDIYALSNPGIKVPNKSQVPEIQDVQIGKNIKKPLNSKIKSSTYYIIGILIFIILSVFIGFIIKQRQEKQFGLFTLLRMVEEQHTSQTSIYGSKLIDILFRMFK